MPGVVKRDGAASRFVGKTMLRVYPRPHRGVAENVNPCLHVRLMYFLLGEGNTCSLEPLRVC